MAIRINLLGEQQAADDLRRRDPVKRIGWVAGLIVGVLVAWSAYLQVKLMAASRDVGRVEAEWKKLELDYNKVVTNMNRITDAQRKWTALQSLASNRFLWATPLNALQFSIVDDIQIVRLKTEQSYVVNEGIKPSTNAVGIVSRGKPATSREKVAFSIEGRDYSARPGDQIFKLQEAIRSNAFFKANLQKCELSGRAVNPPSSAGERAYVFFTLDCQFPEKVH
jgi:hypothetical protein